MLLVQWLQKNTDNSPTCAVYTAFILCVNIFALVSLFGVMALSADRFLAIHLHLRYQELVTHKRVVSVVVFMWVFSVGLSVFKSVVPLIIAIALLEITVVAILVLSTVFYCKIYSAVRRHKNQIQAMQIQQVEQNAKMVTNLTRSRKSALCAFYVYFVFLICYLPVAFTLAARLTGDLNTALKISTLSSWTLVYLNSSLNPVIYCWKMRHIRRAMMDTLRSLFPGHT